MGSLGLPHDALKRLVDALGVTTDFLVDGTDDQAAKARLADRELLRQFQEIERLPDGDKAIVKTFLDAFITMRQLQKLAG